MVKSSLSGNQVFVSVAPEGESCGWGEQQLAKQTGRVGCLLVLSWKRGGDMYLAFIESHLNLSDLKGGEIYEYFIFDE